MGFLKEFRDFALRGNVLDLAVAVVIGTAFNGLVSSFVNNIVTPPIGLAAGRVDLSKLTYVMAHDEAGKPAAELKYGLFAQNVIDFVLVAFSVFIAIKLVNRLFHRQAPPPAGPTRDQELLMEIRDLLEARE